MGAVDSLVFVGIALHMQYSPSVFVLRISLGLLDMGHPK